MGVLQKEMKNIYRTHNEMKRVTSRQLICCTGDAVDVRSSGRNQSRARLVVQDWSVNGIFVSYHYAKKCEIKLIAKRKKNSSQWACSHEGV